ncbi:MAG: leucine-rich repeat domain-containing protein, partial [Deltaproteobacteria bacterium]|nr:leucine-rich repeat domain-containing protein [Deltaproteobacteria bacterium]
MSQKTSKTKTIYNALLFCAVMTICCFNSHGSVFAQDWIWNDYHVTSPTLYQTLYDIVYVDGLHVAVGTNGIIMTSEDTATWNQIDSGTSERLRSITYGFGSFYAVGDDGTILSSENGADWSTISTEIVGDFFSITYDGSDQLVAVGRDKDDAGAFVAFVAVSDDGVTWTETQLPTIATGLTGITYGNGLYVAVGYKKKEIGDDPIIATSLNGVNWNKQVPYVPGGAGVLEDVAYGNGKYVIVGALNDHILFSQDASSWIAFDTGDLVEEWFGVTYTGELFVIAGPQVLSSPDGQDWTLRRDNQADDAWSKGIAYGNGSIVAVGFGGWKSYEERAPDVMVSSGGLLPELERGALIALYNRTDGDHWTDNSGWKDGDLHTDGFAMPGTEGTWYGITCDSMNTFVREIDLSSNGLTDNGVDDSIPAELGNLDSLQLLDLSSNELTGSIPSGLCVIDNLQVLDLSSNQLDGGIPYQLFNIDNLQVLDLSFNQLTDNGVDPGIPWQLGYLANLQILDLSFNQLTGSIPWQLGNLANLQRLYLDSNSLTGNIPSGLGNLGILNYLYLNGNKLRGEIPSSLANLTLLTHTDIGYNALYSNDSAVRTFLDTKDPDWEDTQT